MQSVAGKIQSEIIGLQTIFWMDPLTGRGVGSFTLFDRGGTNPHSHPPALLFGVLFVGGQGKVGG